MLRLQDPAIKLLRQVGRSLFGGHADLPLETNKQIGPLFSFPLNSIRIGFCVANPSRINRYKTFKAGCELADS